MKRVFIGFLGLIALVGLVIGSASGKLPDSVYIWSVVGVIIVCAILIAGGIKPSTHSDIAVDPQLQRKRKYSASLLTVISTVVLPSAMLWKMFTQSGQEVFFVLWLVAPIFIVGTAVTTFVIARRIYAHTKNDVEIRHRSIWFSVALVAILLIIIVF